MQSCLKHIQPMSNVALAYVSVYERMSDIFHTLAYACTIRNSYKIREQTDEDCIDILEKIISNDLQQKPVIENAHRVGPLRDDGSPRPIIAKFLYRPERRNILRKKKLLKNGIYVSEDLIPEDRKRKNDLKAVMQQAFESGKRPKFRNGKLYIDGVLHNN